MGYKPLPGKHFDDTRMSDFPRLADAHHTFVLTGLSLRTSELQPVPPRSLPISYSRPQITLLQLRVTVEITTRATRKLRIESEATSGGGSKKRVVRSQDLAFSNTQWYLNDALVQTEGRSDLRPHPASANKPTWAYEDRRPILLPLYVNFTAFDPGFNVQLSADNSGHSYERLFSPSPFVLTSIRFHTTVGECLIHGPNYSTGNGRNENWFIYSEPKGNMF